MDDLYNEIVMLKLFEQRQYEINRDIGDALEKLASPTYGPGIEDPED